jgi:hypothetical protein
MGMGPISLEVKRPGPKTNHSPPASVEIKIGRAVSPLPARLHDLVLKKLNTKATLLLLFFTNV